MKLRYDIQILRALAVTIVILGHIGIGQIANGNLGVDIFFVISGYLITGLLLKKELSLINFYSRRIKRIAPMALVVITTTALFTFLYYSSAGNTYILKDSIYALFSILNFELAHRAGDYFLQDDSTSLLQHYWSLGIEEQFYLCWPIVLILFTKFFTKRIVLLLTSVIAITSLLYFTYIMYMNPMVGYYSTWGRIWELMAGAIIAMLGNGLTRVVNGKGKLIWLMGVVSLIVISYLGFGIKTLNYIFIVVITMLLLNWRIDFESQRNKKLVKPLIYIGDISFGLYLWHWPIWLLVSRENGSNNLSKIIVLTLTLILSVLTKYLYEDRIRLSKKSNRKTFALFIIIITLASSSLFTMNSLDDKVNLKERLTSSKSKITKVPVEYDDKEKDKNTVTPTDPDKNGEKKVPREPDIFTPLKNLEELNRYLNQASQKSYQAQGIKQDLSKIKEDIGYFSQDGCPVASTSCTLSVNGGREIYLLGDSHANMWFPALARVEEYNKYRVTSLAIPGCPPVPMQFEEGYVEMGREKYDNCQKLLESYISAIKENKPEVLVITGGTQTGKTSWITRYPGLIKSLQPYVKRIIFLGDFIYASADAVECLQDNAKLNPFACGQEVKFLDPGYTDRIKLEEDTIKGIKIEYFNPQELMCNQTFCPAVIGDIVVYRDRFHITRTYARWISNILLDKLNLK